MPADDGLAIDFDYWRRYHTPEEVEEITANSTQTMLVSGTYPIHVRLYEQRGAAATVLIASSLLSYGLHLARLELPFFRVGFNVVQFDLPGLGQSGGPRGGCTVPEFVQAWRDAAAFASRRFGEPLFALGVGEDGVTCYYALANAPHIRAISVHNLFEYGEPGSVQGQGPHWMVRAKAFGLGALSRLRPSTALDGTRIVPWEWIYGGPGDRQMIELLEQDPLSLRRVELRMAHSILERRSPPVPFERCRTPVQVIASDRNRVCPFELVTRNYERLGGPKELVVLEGRPQWEFNRPFHEAYCAHVMRWFEANGAARLGVNGHEPAAAGTAARRERRP